MKLETEFTVYPSWSDAEKDASIECLFNTIKTFCCSFRSCAIWDNIHNTEDVTHCAAIRICGCNPDTVQFFNTDQISKVVREWCCDLCDYLNDITDTHDRYAYSERTVEIEENDWVGGFVIKTYDGDDLEECFHIAPAKDITNDDLNAGQRPVVVGCASKPPAGGARYSASTNN